MVTMGAGLEALARSHIGENLSRVVMPLCPG